ncbi:hypothetical protein T190115A13A_80209 [Tenacibaculum sp. 190524A02b]|uniref:HTH cro/C1-type domain-containing protein n=1 Tax=Tenacibaculum vairaonense TaxID=3137860 RepID=A0ABM9PS37_9FLAO
MSTINDRIKQIFDFYNFKSYAGFAKFIGISHQTASNYLKGKQKPDVDKLSQIIQSFDNISSKWLLTGIGEMINKISKEEVEISDQNVVEEPTVDYTKELKDEKLSEKGINYVIDALLMHEEQLQENKYYQKWLEYKLIKNKREVLEEVKRVNILKKK